MTDKRYLHCLYAEDIRPEVAGTFSIIGAFQGGIQLGSIPGTLPKLAVLATLSFAAEDTIRSLRIEVFMGDKVFQSIEPPPEFITQSLELAKTHAVETEGRGFFIQMMIGIAGVQIEKPGRIRTRAFVDGELWESNSLQIIEAPQGK